MGRRGNARRRPVPWVVCAALAFAVACAPSAEELAPVPEADPALSSEEAMNSLVASYLQAVNRGDADGLAILYTEDAVRINADGGVVTGRDDIRLFAAADYAEFDQELQLHVEENDFSGQLAFLRGTYGLTVMSKEDSSVVTEQVGKWMNVLRRNEDGSWLIAREMANRDHPPGEPPRGQGEEG